MCLECIHRAARARPAVRKDSGLQHQGRHLIQSPTKVRVNGGAVRRPSRNLFDDAPVSLFTVDRRLVVRRANEQARRLLGVHRRSAAVGRRLLDGFDDATGQRLMTALSSLAPADGMSMGEVRWKRNPGDPRVVRVEARAPQGRRCAAGIHRRDRCTQPGRQCRTPRVARRPDRPAQPLSHPGPPGARPGRCAQVHGAWR